MSGEHRSLEAEARRAEAQRAARQVADAAAAAERQNAGVGVGRRGGELESGGGSGEGRAKGGGGVGSGDGGVGRGEGDGGVAHVIRDQFNKKSARLEALAEQMAVLVPMMQAISERLSGGENLAQEEGMKQDEDSKVIGESAKNVPAIAERGTAKRLVALRNKEQFRRHFAL